MKYIKMGIKWTTPITKKQVVTDYVIPVPLKLTKSKYLWIATGMILPYKVNCFMNRLKNKKNYIFNNKK